MNYRTNEDKISPLENCNYNLIFLVEDISEESGPVVWPVTLQEVKKYLRLEGFVDSSSQGAILQAPLTLQLLPGQFSVQSSLLAQTGVMIASVTKEGQGFSIITTGLPSAGQVLFTEEGELIFLNESGGETVNVVYGIQQTQGQTADQFDFDDDLLNDLIAEGSKWVEDYTGLHLRAKSLQVVFVNGAGMLELPGPVNGEIVIKNSAGAAQGGNKFYGTSFPKLETKYSDKVIAEYSAGYTPVNTPEGLKLAIMAYIADNYEHRGDEVELPANSKRAALKAKPYRRTDGLWG